MISRFLSLGTSEKSDYNVEINTRDQLPVLIINTSAANRNNENKRHRHFNSRHNIPVNSAA